MKLKNLVRTQRNLVRTQRKYRKHATQSDIDSLTIEVVKKGKKIVGFTVWAGNHWILDGSVMKDKTEETCRVYLGNRLYDIEFEYVDKGSQYFDRRYLELRRK